MVIQLITFNVNLNKVKKMKKEINKLALESLIREQEITYLRLIRKLMTLNGIEYQYEHYSLYKGSSTPNLDVTKLTKEEVEMIIFEMARNEVQRDGDTWIFVAPKHVNDFIQKRYNENIERLLELSGNR
jgi:hypothetical protein